MLVPSDVDPDSPDLHHPPNIKLRFHTNTIPNQNTTPHLEIQLTMRIINQQALLPSFLLPLLAAAAGLDCTHIRADGVGWDLTKLGGARSAVHNIDHEGISSTNTTYTIDICRPLGKVKGSKVPVEKQCPGGTRGMSKTQILLLRRSHH